MKVAELRDGVAIECGMQAAQRNLDSRELRIRGFDECTLGAQDDTGPCYRRRAQLKKFSSIDLKRSQTGSEVRKVLFYRAKFVNHKGHEGTRSNAIEFLHDPPWPSW